MKHHLYIISCTADFAIDGAIMIIKRYDDTMHKELWGLRGEGGG